MSKSKPQQSEKGLKTGTRTTTKRRKSATATSATTEGKRVTGKRSDRRWVSPDGQVWASKFEYEVYVELARRINDAGIDADIFKCGPDSTLSYSTPVKNGRCSQCNSVCTVQDRTYTPDLVIVSRVQGQTPRYVYLETKGYFEGEKRNLFRQVIKSYPDRNIRIVAGADHWVTRGKSRLTDWAKRFKIKLHLWKDLKLEDLLT